jgi:serine/threonine-protein kinase RIO1
MVMVRHGLTHGDLPAFKLLVHRGRLMVIDVPRVVDVVANPGGVECLVRDVRNVCAWFARRAAVARSGRPGGAAGRAGGRDVVSVMWGPLWGASRPGRP